MRLAQYLATAAAKRPIPPRPDPHRSVFRRDREAMLTLIEGEDAAPECERCHRDDAHADITGGLCWQCRLKESDW